MGSGRDSLSGEFEVTPFSGGYVTFKTAPQGFGDNLLEIGVDRCCGSKRVITHPRKTPPCGDWRLGRGAGASGFATDRFVFLPWAPVTVTVVGAVDQCRGRGKRGAVFSPIAVFLPLARVTVTMVGAIDHGRGGGGEARSGPLACYGWIAYFGKRLTTTKRSRHS